MDPHIRPSWSSLLYVNADCFGGTSETVARNHVQSVDLQLETVLKTHENRRFYGAPGRIRTSDLLVRSQALYPAELRAHIALLQLNKNTRCGHLNQPLARNRLGFELGRNKANALNNI